ncbi:MAG: TlpA family protein disulfide reductase [Bryobacter sp.]|nr:TlpA family protein disulfide reductase [Bryobacter sp. CoA8 C33]
MSRFQFLAALGLIAIGLTSCTTQSKADEADSAVRPSKDRKKAPEFKLKDSDGKLVSLASYKGKTVLLNFWATWCGPCKVEIPWFIEFENKYKDKGLAVLGVAMDEEGWEVIKPYIAEKKVNYRILAGDDSTAQLYGGVDSLPTTFLIDKDGMIAGVHVGLVSKSEYEKDIQALLGLPAGK